MNYHVNPLIQPLWYLYTLFSPLTKHTSPPPRQSRILGDVHVFPSCLDAASHSSEINLPVPFRPTHTPNRLWQSMAKIQPLKVKFQFRKEIGKHNCYCPVAEIKFSWAESAGCPALAGSTILGHCNCWSLLMAVGIALTFVLQNLGFCPSGCSFLLSSVAISFSSVKFSYNNLGLMYSKIHHFWYISL